MRPAFSHALVGLGAAVLGFSAAYWSRPHALPREVTRVTAGQRAGATESRFGPAPTGAVAPTAVATVIQATQRAPDRATRLYRFALGLRALAPGELPALFAALRRERSPESPELLAMLCSVWAERDGAAAFAAARECAATDGQFGAMHAAILAWARQDPPAARAALTAAGLTDLAGDEMAALVQGWAASDAAAVETFLAAHLPRGREDEVPAAVHRGFESIARARIEADPAAGLAWYQQLPDGLKERMRQAVLTKLTAVDPRRATEWLAQDATAQVGASDLIPLLRGLALEGFDQQFAWARSAANEHSREAAMAAVVQESAYRQLVPLGEWLAAHCDDASLVPACSNYALQVVRKSPNAAITWALSLGGPDVRQATLNTVAAEWITINPRAARDWAQQTKLVDYESLIR